MGGFSSREESTYNISNNRLFIVIRVFVKTSWVTPNRVKIRNILSQDVTRVVE